MPCMRLIKTGKNEQLAAKNFTDPVNNKKDDMRND